MTVREFLDQYLVATNKHQFSLVEAFLSDDCLFWFSSGSYKGIGEARRAFEKTWEMIKQEVYSISDLAWIAESDQVAVCVYTFHWRGIIDGQPCEGKGRGTSSFRKENNAWKIIHEHLSHFPK